MRMPIRVLLLCASLAVAGGPLIAESGLEAKARQRIDLDLVDASAADVFGSFAQMLGAKLDLATAVDGKVTVRLQNVRVETALEVVCESIGCRSELSWGEIPVLRILPVEPRALDPVGEDLRQSLDSPIAISTKDAAAMDVLVTFSRILQAELEVELGSTRKVTLELQHVPASQALDALGAILKVDWVLREENVDGKLRRILRISPRKPILPTPADQPKR